MPMGPNVKKSILNSARIRGLHLYTKEGNPIHLDNYVYVTASPDCRNRQAEEETHGEERIKN